MDTKNKEISSTTVGFKEPDMYVLIMLNDDFTPMEFVVDVLINMFFKSETDAYSLMMKIHNEGHAEIGVYPLDIAHSKKVKVERFARECSFPLRIKIQKIIK